jgi:DNA polymerase V
LTREKFEKYLAELSDFDLYLLAKNNILGDKGGLEVFDWQSEMIFLESERRHPDIYRSAREDAEMLLASRNAVNEGINVNDIYRPSLMSRAEIAAMFGGRNVDYIDKKDDSAFLREMLGDKDSAYLLCKVSGDSMTGSGIYNDDILIVERAPAENGKIVVASVNDALFVKRYRKDEKGEWLHSSNEKYPPFKITSALDFRIIGIVRYIMHAAV